MQEYHFVLALRFARVIIYHNMSNIFGNVNTYWNTCIFKRYLEILKKKKQGLKYFNLVYMYTHITWSYNSINKKNEIFLYNGESREKY